MFYMCPSYLGRVTSLVIAPGHISCSLPLSSIRYNNTTKSIDKHDFTFQVHSVHTSGLLLRILNPSLTLFCTSRVPARFETSYLTAQYLLFRPRYVPAAHILLLCPPKLYMYISPKRLHSIYPRRLLAEISNRKIASQLDSLAFCIWTRQSKCRLSLRLKCFDSKNYLKRSI